MGKAPLSLDSLKQVAEQSAPAQTSGQPDVVKSDAPQVTKQLSVKVTLPVYERLRKAAYTLEMSHQDIGSDAVAEWLTKNGF
ncbi:hypothetical protein [Acinetobacter sp. A47]|uniref:hypothetical protein n=1 Tax=Acinetobacter sp. A47 TaxID=1561217 RepID=UPI0005710932|nr:hypothetical protein [Acinetobacter sp. A47]